MSYEAFKTTGDITSVGIVIGTVLEFLPAIAAILTIVWTTIRIYETDTIQKFLRRFKRKL